MYPIAFQVGFTSEGKLISLDVQMYLNSGKAVELSKSVSTKTEISSFLKLTSYVSIDMHIYI